MIRTRECPFVSVIVLNFNGLVFLERCFSSLDQLAYPRERFETILVDNASTDRSVPFVQERFPWVKIIQSPANLGFAAGNNVGIREAKGEYIALLNNDTWVEKNWLSELITVCEQDATVGACTPKILLFNNRLRIRLKTDPFRPSDFGIARDSRELGVLLEQASVRQADGERSIDCLEGFHRLERFAERSYRWSMGEAALGVPVSPDDNQMTLRLRLSSPRPKGAPAGRVSLFVGERELAQFIPEQELNLHEIALEHDVLNHARPVIQNAGSLILSDGSGRDRGAIVRNSQQIFEEDHGQYDRVEEVFAACAAGAVYRRKMLDDVGLLDEYFFMYYEDTDLAWRARLKGWKIMYTPHAVMRHVHCGTSIEWSPSFIFHSYRNRLATLLKNAPFLLVFREWTRSFASLLMLGLKVGTRRIFMINDSHLTLNFRLRARALRSLVLSLPELYRKRQGIQRTRRVHHGEVIRWMQAIQ